MSRRRKSETAGFLVRLSGRLHRDERGVSAVEFALIAPLMILIYWGLVELCQAFMAQKRASHTTSMVADLSSQSASLKRADLQNYFAIGEQVMRPFPAGALQVRVSSLTRDSKGVVRVDWSQSLRPTAFPARGKTSIVDSIPDDLIENGESLIMSETVYDYQLPFARFLNNSGGVTQFRNEFYLRPRVSGVVECSDC